LEAAFDGQISVKEVDLDVEGSFEVIVEGDLIWSKAHWQMDFPTTEKQVELISDEIRDSFEILNGRGLGSS